MLEALKQIRGRKYYVLTNPYYYYARNVRNAKNVIVTWSHSRCDWINQSHDGISRLYKGLRTAQTLLIVRSQSDNISPPGIDLGLNHLQVGACLYRRPGTVAPGFKATPLSHTWVKAPLEAWALVWSPRHYCVDAIQRKTSAGRDQPSEDLEDYR